MKKIHKILICFILIIIFVIFNYKNFISGNNINSKEKIVEKILSGSLEYEAKIRVKVISNKNENVYEIKQKETLKESYQEVISEGKVKGLKILCTDNVLKVENSKLNLQKIYEDYAIISNNYLFINSFLKDYKNAKVKEEEDTIIIDIKLENYNKYIKYKEIYLDKNTGIPIKMIIKDSDKHIRACIEYINFKIFQ